MLFRSVVECDYVNAEHRRAVRRAPFSRIRTVGADPAGEQNRFDMSARQYVTEMSERLGTAIPFTLRTRFEDLRLRSGPLLLRRLEGDTSRR